MNDVSTSGDAEACGAIMLIYEHQVRMPSDNLTDVQNEYPVHLELDNCLEVLVRGK